MYSNIDERHHYFDFFEGKIKELGGEKRGIKRYIIRKNVNSPFPEKGAYFGCINEGEEVSGAYSDLSIVVFPSDEKEDTKDRWIIALGVGSLGFKNDYNIASLPGTRRLFMKYLDKNTFIKSVFNIDASDGFNSFCSENNIPDSLYKAVNGYEKVLLTSTLIDPNDDAAAKKIISKYLALYAILRNWPSNNNQKRVIQDALNIEQTTIKELDDVKELVKKRRFVVLQGAPGTGKTRLAKMLPAEGDIVFFTQFHAETTYSDFVYGILPDVDSNELKYSSNEGVFVQAIREALKPENKDKKVYLIIDEINRANLSNVLGPSFYLFEPTMINRNVKIDVCPGLKLEQLPENLYVIATMNTADRSLAVVDFALRRRFAWYTILPHDIVPDKGYYFCKEEFDAIANIFERYASDEELNLQPGHAYFIVPDSDHDAINNRLRYEIMPLIKEYLLDGMLSQAKDDFVNYFRKRIKEEMFK